LVKQGTVTEVDVIHPIDGEREHYFTVTYALPSGKEVVVNADRVVLASGSSTVMEIPDWACRVRDCVECKAISSRIQHSIELPCDSKHLAVTPESRLLVVGGGMTSAQLVLLGFKAGFNDVVMVSRSKLRTQQFDVSLDWVGRKSNVLYSQFWGESDFKSIPGSFFNTLERSKMIQKAKRGGSITEEYMQLLDREIKASRLATHQEVEVKECEWNTSACVWEVVFSDMSRGSFHNIWLGTGSRLDIEQEACLQKLFAKFPINVIGGLPVLDDGIWVKYVLHNSRLGLES
jgi:cation diffusion facilitator CzcD-associated flavoprotein CzcO